MREVTEPVDEPTTEPDPDPTPDDDNGDSDEDSSARYDGGAIPTEPAVDPVTGEPIESDPAA